MPSWGIRCLAELQENYSVRENDCYSNYYSETSGKGDRGVPPTGVWSVCPRGWEAPCADSGRWSISSRLRRVGGSCGSRRSGSSFSQPGPGRQGGEPEPVRVEECRQSVGRCQLVCGACVCMSVHACKGGPRMMVRSADLVPICLFET